MGEDEVIFEVQALDALPRIYDSQALIYRWGRDKRAGELRNVQEKGLREGIEG